MNRWRWRPDLKFYTHKVAVHVVFGMILLFGGWGNLGRSVPPLPPVRSGPPVSAECVLLRDAIQIMVTDIRPLRLARLKVTFYTAAGRGDGTGYAAIGRTFRQGQVARFTYDRKLPVGAVTCAVTEWFS